MAVELRVPQLGESVVDATVSRWLKHPGESVNAGEAVVELETDKVNVEVPAEESGVLESATAHEGETVHVGDLLGTLTADAEQPSPRPSATPLPRTGEGTQGKADSVSVEGNRSQSGPPSPGVGSGDGGEGSGPPNPPITGGTIGNSGAPPVARPDSVSAPTRSPQDWGAGGASATPVARRLAEEKHLDLRLVKGTGPGGRVTKEDVATYIERTADSPVTAETLARQALPSAGAEEPRSRGAEELAAGRPGGPTTGESATTRYPLPARRSEERVRLSRRRLTIAQRLVEAQQTAAMLTTFNEADMSGVMEIRKRRKEAFQARFGIGLGFMSFFTKAAVAALKAFPYLNSEIQSEEVVLKRYYDIGVAVSTDEGLVVPVVRDADARSFAEIERQIADLATRARSGKLTLQELRGGTFTITNGGIFGSLLSTPILNTPQVGILGMHRIQERPIAVNGQVVIRPMMYLALSYDHRIVDGSEAVRFLVRIKELIEDPSLLLLEG